MKDIISSLIPSLEEFLSKVAGSPKESLTGCVISFSAQIKNVNLESNLDRLVKSSESSFYFSSPSNNVSFLTFGEVLNIEENGAGRFAATDKKIKELSSHFLNNWDKTIFPLFVCGMKFNVEHSDEDWKDFNDSSWFIPEIVIFNSTDKTYLLYNFYIEQNFSKAKLVEKFKTKTENILKEFSNNISASFPKVIKSNGLSPKDKKKWKLLINEALEHISNNNLNKIVLSRKIELILSEEINLNKVIRYFKDDYPDCYIFNYHRGKSNFFGASPELLLALTSDQIEIHAIAGSSEIKQGSEENAQSDDNLKNNKKNIEEHKYVLEYIKNSISSFTEEINFNEVPDIKKLKNIQHLFTKVKAGLKKDVSIINILKELHPTPAVCGSPKDAALSLIKKIENQRRGLYAGIIGWFNFYDEGEFVVAIRSALSIGKKLVAYAGSGIVEGSEPDSEFEETELKLKTILSLFDDKSKGSLEKD